jgi:hypothetical protein
MAISAHLPGYRWFHVFRNSAIRTGVYVGVCMTLVFTAWLVIANHFPLLERFAAGRNLAAAMVLSFLALIPVLRFLLMPGHLLASSLIAWLIFSASYRALCLFFGALGEWHSTFQVFMIGAVAYMIITTLCWIGTTIWKVRGENVSHPNHHVS